MCGLEAKFFLTFSKKYSRIVKTVIYESKGNFSRKSFVPKDFKFIIYSRSLIEKFLNYSWKSFPDVFSNFNPPVDRNILTKNFYFWKNFLYMFFFGLERNLFDFLPKMVPQGWRNCISRLQKNLSGRDYIEKVTLSLVFSDFELNFFYISVRRISASSRTVFYTLSETFWAVFSKTVCLNFGLCAKGIVSVDYKISPMSSKLQSLCKRDHPRTIQFFLEFFLYLKKFL